MFNIWKSCKKSFDSLISLFQRSLKHLFRTFKTIPNKSSSVITVFLLFLIVLFEFWNLTHIPNVITRIFSSNEIPKVILYLSRQIVSVLFASLFVATFLDYYKIQKEFAERQSLIKDSFYNAFDIELPETIQSTIKTQLFDSKVYRSHFRVDYLFEDYEEDREQLKLTAIMQYQLINASNQKITYPITREVEKSNKKDIDKYCILVNNEKQDYQDLDGRNDKHITYRFPVSLNPNDIVDIATTSVSLKKKNDTDNIYSYILAESMEVNVSFLSQEKYNCVFFSLCDNSSESEENNKLLTDYCPKNHFNWKCSKPLLKYQGVKIDWNLDKSN